MAEHDWAVVESVVEYDTPWYEGGYDLVEQPDGTRKKYYWAALSPAVVVVALDDDDVIFVEQYRPPVGETFLELVAGLVEPGESYETAGARELAEETGYEAGRVVPLASFWVSTGVLRHERGIVFADDLEPGEPDRGDSEFMRVTTRPVGEALAAAREAPANDATIEGLLLAERDGYL